MKKNLTVLITGCSSGIGKSLAEKFHSEGHRVIATSRDKSKIGFLAEKGIDTYSLDVNSSKSISDFSAEVKSKYSDLEILINNAGYGQIGPAVEIPDEIWQKQFKTNLFGPAALMRELVSVMVSRKNGMIVNVGSISGITPTPFSAAYCATKAAMHAYSDVLRMELLPFGIKVITVQPGAIRSNFGNAADESIKDAFAENSLYLKYAKQIHYRAEISQIGATSAEKFADKLYCKLMKKNPPLVIRIGSKSTFLPFLKRWIPDKLLDKILSRNFGLSGSGN